MTNYMLVQGRALQMLKWVTYGVVAVLVVLLAPLVWIMVSHNPDNAAEQSGEPVLPWQIAVLDEGYVRVFNLIPGRSTLQQAIQHFGLDYEIAVVSPPQARGSLEAFFETANAGYITGKALVKVDLADDKLNQLRDRAVKVEFMESATRKYTLHPDDLAWALQQPFQVIAFIPSADLNEQVILERFGTPAERIRSTDQIEHFLYPQHGLDITLDAQGKELLQYVAPKDFELLRQPLYAERDSAAQE